MEDDSQKLANSIGFFHGLPSYVKDTDLRTIMANIKGLDWAIIYPRHRSFRVALANEFSPQRRFSLATGKTKLNITSTSAVLLVAAMII